MLRARATLQARYEEEEDRSAPFSIGPCPQAGGVGADTPALSSIPPVDQLCRQERLCSRPVLVPVQP